MKDTLLFVALLAAVGLTLVHWSVSNESALPAPDDPMRMVSPDHPMSTAKVGDVIEVSATVARPSASETPKPRSSFILEDAQGRPLSEVKVGDVVFVRHLKTSFDDPAQTWWVASHETPTLDPWRSGALLAVVFAVLRVVFSQL